MLGIYPKHFNVSSKQVTLIDFRLLPAKKIITIYQRELHMPSIHVWAKEMASYVVMERLTCVKTFSQISWSSR